MAAPWDSVPPSDALHLAPWAWVQLDNTVRAHGFEYLSGVHPDVVVALNDAREGMRGCIEPILGDVSAGRIRLDDPRLPALTEDAYAELVASRPSLARHIRCGRSADGRFAWEWRQDPAFRPTHQADRVRLVNALEGKQGGGVLKALGPQAIGWLAGELCGHHTAGSLRAAITARGSEAAVMERIVADLQGMGALLRAPMDRLRAHWLREVRDQDVVSLGHAALLTRHGDDFVLFDPWLVPWLSDAPTATLWTTLLPRPSALVFTHEHADHFDGRALTSFPKDIPVLVPARRPQGLGYDYTAQLTALGFTRVVELAPGQSFRVGPAEIEAVPFYGEDPCDVDLPRSCWIVCDRGRNTLVCADSGPTNAGRSALGDGVVDDLRARRGPVHLLLSSQQQLQELRALSVYSAFCPPGTWFRSGENGFLTDDYLTELARRSGARQFVSYATGGADWLTDALPFVFGKQNPRRTAMITATWTPAAALAPRLAAFGCGWHPARACDIYRPRRDGGTDILPEVPALSPVALFTLDHPRPAFLDKLPKPV